MINLLVGIVVGVAFGFQLGFYGRKLLDLIQQQAKPKEAAKPAAVTYGQYTPPNENHAGNTDSKIIEPKTPQRIAWEAQQAIEKQALNR